MGCDGLLTRDRGMQAFVCGMAFLYLDCVFISESTFPYFAFQGCKGNVEKKKVEEMYVYVPDKTRTKTGDGPQSPSNTNKAGQNDVRLNPQVTKSANHSRSNTTLHTSRDTGSPLTKISESQASQPTAQAPCQAKHGLVVPFRAHVSRLTGGEGLPCVPSCRVLCPAGHPSRAS